MQIIKASCGSGGCSTPYDTLPVDKKPIKIK
jgi:hypothetical protein